MINFINHGPFNKAKRYFKVKLTRVYIYLQFYRVGACICMHMHGSNIVADATCPYRKKLLVMMCMHAPRNHLLVDQFFYANFSLAVFPSVFCDTLWKLTTAQSHMLLETLKPSVLSSIASSSVAQRLAINTGARPPCLATHTAIAYRALAATAT
jgi:hypothetical protein